MKSIPIYILNIEECYALNERLLNVFKADLVKEVFVSKLLPNLVEINADLSAIIANTGSSDLTKQLADKDRARDAAFVGFRDYCKAFSNSSDPVKSAAARKLMALIRKIGWSLQRQGYTEQTASVEVLNEALAEPGSYAQAATDINAETWLRDLHETNAAFEAIVKQKNESIAHDDVPLIADCKRRMVKYLKPLLNYLKLMAELKPKTYADTVNRISEEIEYVMPGAKARRTRRENQQTEVEIVEEAIMFSEPVA